MWYRLFSRLQLARQGVVRVAVLSLMVVVVWCWQHHRISLSTWSVPLDDTGDSLQNLARIKAASEGDLVPFGAHRVRRLAAPFIADWAEFPASDDIANYGLGLVARLVGVMAAGNLALLLAHLTAAWSFYLCARLLRQCWEWAWAGALLFAFSFFSIQRGLPHLWLAYTYPVPLAVLAVLLIASGRRTIARPAWRWLCYGTAAVLGASYAYNLFLFLQLLGWAVLGRWLKARWSSNVRLGLACGLVAVGVFSAVNAHVLFHRREGSGTSLLVRNYAATEIYALKPIELLLPPSGHHGGWLAALGYRYLRWTDWRGETFSPYLGLAGAIGLVWMLAAYSRDVLLRRRNRQAGYALCALWILLFSSIGGINSILAFYLGLDVFRASNRYSIFLLALALLYAASRLTRWSRTWRPGMRPALAGLTVIVGLWDQLPVRTGAASERQLAEQVQGDQRLGAELERRLGSGATVFQLPVLDFPEGRPQLQVNEYDPLRLFLATRTLRFSYGELKNRAPDAWQHDCAGMSPAALVAALESYGFSAIDIDRRGYADDAEQLLAELAAAGRPETIAGLSPTSVAVLLHPAAHPVLPLARSFTYGTGWNRLTESESSELRSLASNSPLLVRWTNGSAFLSYYNPYSKPLGASLRLALSSVNSRTVQLLVNGRDEARVRLGPATAVISAPAIEMQPGFNRLDLVTPDPAVRASEQRLSLRALGVQTMEMRFSAGPRVELTGDPGGDR